MSLQASADELVALIRAVVEEMVAEVQPYRATVTGLSQGKVKIRAADEEADDFQFYARTAGIKVAEGDEVIVQRISGEPVIVGMLQNETPGVRSIDGGLDASEIVQGEIPGARIAPLPASHIASGTLSTSRIPNLAASIINAGTFDDARIPNLNASKVTAGEFALARIPTLTAGKIPDLDAAKIATGLIDKARIPNITVKEADTIRVSDLADLRFHGGQFTVTDNGGGEAEITLDGPIPVVKDGDAVVANNVRILKFHGGQFRVEYNGVDQVTVEIVT